MGTLPTSFKFQFLKNNSRERLCLLTALSSKEVVSDILKNMFISRFSKHQWWTKYQMGCHNRHSLWSNHGDHSPASCIGFLLKTVGLWNKKWTLPWQLGSWMHKSQPDVSAHDHNALFTIVHMSLFITSCWKVMTHTWRIKKIYLQTCTERLNFCVSCTT